MLYQAVRQEIVETVRSTPRTVLHLAMFDSKPMHSFEILIKCCSNHDHKINGKDFQLRLQCCRYSVSPKPHVRGGVLGRNGTQCMVKRHESSRTQTNWTSDEHSLSYLNAMLRHPKTMQKVSMQYRAMSRNRKRRVHPKQCCMQPA